MHSFVIFVSYSLTLPDWFATATVLCPCLHFVQIAEELRSSVHSETGGLTCSAGVAANRLLAKVLLICGKYYICPKSIF